MSVGRSVCVWAPGQLGGLSTPFYTVATRITISRSKISQLALKVL